MAIEFTHIHNVVRTYQRTIDILPSARQGAEQVRNEKEDQISISSDAREHNLFTLRMRLIL